MGFLGRISAYRGTLETGLILLGSLFLLYWVRDSLTQTVMTSTFHLPTLFLSLLLISAAFTMNAVRWGITFRLLTAVSPPLHRIGATYTYYQATTYIPGAIWQFLGIGERGRKMGAQRVESTSSMVLHEVIGVTAALLVAAAYGASQTATLSMWPILLLAVGLGAIVIHPRVFTPLINTPLSWFRNEKIEHTLTYWHLLSLLGLSIVTWCVAGAGFALFVNSMTGGGVAIGSGIGIYSAAWSAGFIILIVPGGLGVREGVMVWLLAPFLPVKTAVAVSLGARLWAVVPELVFLSVFGLIKTRHLFEYSDTSSQSDSQPGR